MPTRGGWSNRGPRRPSGRAGRGNPSAPGNRPARPSPPKRTGGLGLRPLGPGVFELIHPRCVEEMRPDYEEGLELWKAGEPEDARDALRYALQGCGDNLWVHVALGRIALEAFNDPSLARGHFGYGFELAQRAIPSDFSGRIPRDRPANRPLFEAMDGLIECLHRLGRDPEAAELRALGERWR
jgi:hypothetical protein